jgi:hypothetical protein
VEPHATPRLPARTLLVGVLAALALLPIRADAGSLILNEYNAVASGNYLEDDVGKFDPYLGPTSGQGNGGDWFELVTIEDELDIRGWDVEIIEAGIPGDHLTFSDELVWSSLRAGTIITISEDQLDDISYDPSGGDWNLTVQACTGCSGTYITAENFPVSSHDWEIVIRDALGGSIVFGPVGERTAANAGVNNSEVFKLQGNPSAAITASSLLYDDGTSSTWGHANVWGGGAQMQDLSGLRELPEPSVALLVCLGFAAVAARRAARSRPDV